LLGGCGLTNPNRRHQFANLYYWVRNSAARQGVAPAAVRLAARFAFAELRLQRVEIVVDRALCIGSGDCVDTAPDVFQLDEEDKAVVVDPDGASVDDIIAAAGLSRSAP